MNKSFRKNFHFSDCFSIKKCKTTEKITNQFDTSSNLKFFYEIVTIKSNRKTRFQDYVKFCLFGKKFFQVNFIPYKDGQIYQNNFSSIRRKWKIFHFYVYVTKQRNKEEVRNRNSFHGSLNEPRAFLNINELTDVYSVT